MRPKSRTIIFDSGRLDFLDGESSRIIVVRYGSTLYARVVLYLIDKNPIDGTKKRALGEWAAKTHDEQPDYVAAAKLFAECVAELRELQAEELAELDSVNV